VRERLARLVLFGILDDKLAALAVGAVGKAGVVRIELLTVLEHLGRELVEVGHLAREPRDWCD